MLFIHESAYMLMIPLIIQIDYSSLDLHNPHSLACSLTNSITHLLICLYIWYSIVLVNSHTHALTHSLTHLLAQSLTHSSLAHSLAHSIAHSLSNCFQRSSIFLSIHTGDCILYSLLFMHTSM